MNNSDDHINPQITRALRQQADQIQEGPLTMADITGKARSIQRRRTLATIAGAAAVVAVIAPVGVIALNRGGHNAGPPVSSSSGTPTTVPSSPAAAPTYTVDMTPDVDGTYNGGPMIPQWMDGTIADAHGNATAVGQVRSFALAPDGSAWIGITAGSSGDNYVTRFAIPDGKVLSKQPTGSLGIATTPDGASVAYLTHEGKDVSVGTLTLLGAHARTWQIQNPGYSTPVGILGNGDVVLENSEATQVTLAKQDGNVTTIPGKYFRATSTSTATGLVAVQTKSNADLTSCWALVDVSGDEKAQTCDYALGQFSADGRYIVGMGSQQSGAGPTRLHLLEAATLQPVATFDPPKDGYFWGATAWTGDTILADVFSHGEWGLAWLSADGIKMQRSANKPGDGIEPPPYLFGAGPLTALAP
jgi:hypothetical protein